MEEIRGRIMSKSEFLQHSLYAKEQYEGLLVSMDPDNSFYNIGIQLDENKVVVVDRTTENSIRERIQNWAPQIHNIQSQYRAKNDAENYSRH